MVVVNCLKNLGAPALNSPPRELIQRNEESASLLVIELDCMGDNTGSYFREPADERRIKALIVDPFSFDLSPDPLKQAPQAAARPNRMFLAKSSGGYASQPSVPVASAAESTATVAASAAEVHSEEPEGGSNC